MAIKNILVHIDNSSACEYRVQVATQLAIQHDAQLSGINVIPEFPEPTYYEAQISADIILEIDRKALESALITQRKYVKLAKEAGLSLSVAVEKGNLISILDDYARFTDLLILGKNYPEDPQNLSEALADNMVLEAGAPCLIVPHSSTSRFTAKRVLVAWNASREAARTLKDALPILKRADTVEVLLVNPSHQGANKENMHSKNISSFLEQHSIKSEVRIDSSNKSIPGAAILTRASEFAADIIIMGAYGHSRLREIILGGVTREILHEMTVPVFISH